MVANVPKYSMMANVPKYSQSIQNRMNNDRGHLLERMIDQACLYYKNCDIAMIEKTPEPFRVKGKNSDGTFVGWFTGMAQPDYKGTLAGGRAIAFEAKMTTTGKLKRTVITENQSVCLKYHHQMGAVVGVCCLINNTAGFVPWSVWKDMKLVFGHQHLTEEDLMKYQVPTIGYVDFLRISERS
ncbi:Holliday junction resolvase RecU [Enterococcus sp. AD013-P3]|uniref:Holliday junction resolvase RecU n=1 Tax=Enterococcus sp. AD013-P3 TaxID=3411036 RepID=UPI003B923D36